MSEKAQLRQGSDEQAEVKSEKEEAALMKRLEAAQSGYGGIDRNGRLVDRREHKDAVPIAENKMFDTPKPKDVK